VYTVANTRSNIWQLQARRDVDGLVAALQDADPEVRRRAANALRTIEATQAVPALKIALRNESDSQVKLDVSAALHLLDQHTDVTGLTNMRDIDGLIRVLKSRNVDNAVAAAQALGQLGDRMAVEPLVIVFQNASSPPRVRLAAAQALLELKSAPAVVTLLGALQRDSWQVRRNAAAVLGQIQASWAVEPLIAALNDSHPIVRRTAAAALRRIATPDAIAALRLRFGGPPAPPAKTKAPVSPPPASPQPALVAAPRVAVEPARAAAKALEPGLAQPTPAPKLTIDTRDTQPVKPVETPAQPEPEPAPPEPDRASLLTQPVMKLIAFLKKRAADTT
jgi:HEAT repeat protein